MLSTEKTIQLFRTFIRNRYHNTYVSCRDPSAKYLSTTSLLLREGGSDPTINFVNENDNLFKKLRNKEFNINYVVNELKKYKEELSKNFFLNHLDFQIRHPLHTTDMLFTFEKQESLNIFDVATDQLKDKGNSTATLEVTQDGTALFSGIISSKRVTSGTFKPDGYAIMMSRGKQLPFGRYTCYDWTYYSHLVFKIRGDGRTYNVVLPTPEKYDLVQYIQYVHPLYTRGGPYWQIYKIPFSHFFCSLEGSITNHQSVIEVKKISKIGILLADGKDGPFKLEIDYVGLEFNPYHRPVCPYEEYYFGK